MATDKTDEVELQERDEDARHCVRTAVVRILLPQGTKDDAEFDLDRALRAIRRFGDPLVDELRVATAEEIRKASRPR